MRGARWIGTSGCGYQPQLDLHNCEIVALCTTFLARMPQTTAIYMESFEEHERRLNRVEKNWRNFSFIISFPWSSAFVWLLILFAFTHLFDARTQHFNCPAGEDECILNIPHRHHTISITMETIRTSTMEMIWNFFPSYLKVALFSRA